MSLKRRIIISVTILLVLNVLIISTVTIYNMNSKGQKDIEAFRKEEFENYKNDLKNLIDVAYSLVETNYSRTINDSALLLQIKKDGLHDKDSLILPLSDQSLLAMHRKKAQESILQQTLTELSRLKFDNGEGYFWVTDITLPYPKMLMHASRPQDTGKVMNDPKFNTEKYQRKNIYQARTELCNNLGEGFIEYEINKPGSDEIDNKLSYSRLFQPTGWIISTGIYTDQIDVDVIKKTAAINSQINSFILITILVSILVILIGVYLTNRLSNKIIEAINQVKSRLKALSKGKKVATLHLDSNDELTEMASSLNELLE